MHCLGLFRHSWSPKPGSGLDRSRQPHLEKEHGKVPPTYPKEYLGHDFQPRSLRDMSRCLGDILGFLSGKMSGRHVNMSGRHLGIFSGKMPERHVKISYADTSALFSERHVKMSGRHFSRKILRDTFRCLGDILAFFSGKMSVRNVKILPCL